MLQIFPIQKACASTIDCTACMLNVPIVDKRQFIVYSQSRSEEDMT
jgi:hypothetical protein